MWVVILNVGYLNNSLFYWLLWVRNSTRSHVWEEPAFTSALCSVFTGPGGTACQALWIKNWAISHAHFFSNSPQSWGLDRQSSKVAYQIAPESQISLSVGRFEHKIRIQFVLCPIGSKDMDKMLFVWTFMVCWLVAISDHPSSYKPSEQDIIARQQVIIPL